MRDHSGNPAIFFVALITVTAVIIFGITNFSQFMVINGKVNHAIKEAELTALAHIRENLSDGILIQDPDNASLILNDTRNLVNQVALDSFNQKTKDFLLARNNNDLSNIFANSILEINGNKIDLQLIFEANLGTSIFENYQKKGRFISTRPSEIQSSANLEFDCGGNCGACGTCNPHTNICIQKPRTLINAFGQYLEASDGVNPVSLGHDCKGFYNTLQGSFCRNKTNNEGWIRINENGVFGCRTEPSLGDPQCIFMDNYIAWNIVREGQPGGPKAVIRFAGDIITELGINETQFSSSGLGFTNNFRGELNPFATNLDDAHGEVYSICNQAI